MESIKQLRKICQDKGYQEHITLRFYRVFSIYITKIFLILGLKPNFITLFGFLLGIMGGYMYIKGYFLLGSIFFVIFYIFDNVDGEIARYRKSSSKFGAWLDTVAGHLLYPYFFLALGLGIFFQTEIHWYIVLGAVAAIAKLIERSVPSIPISSDSQQLLKNRDDFSKSESFLLQKKELLSHIGKFPVLFPTCILCVLLGRGDWFLWFFAIYSILFASGKVVLTGWRIYRSQ